MFERAPADIGTFLIDAVEGAISDLDSGGYSTDDLRAWGPIRLEACERFDEAAALATDASPEVRASGCAAISALARAAFHQPYARELGVEPMLARFAAVADRLPFADPDPGVRAAALEAVRWIRGDGPGLAVVLD